MTTRTSTRTGTRADGPRVGGHRADVHPAPGPRTGGTRVGGGQAEPR
ncbi:hypothetical protein FHX79_113796 [Streptomyces cavourensis]|nr:hypothetical protein FHX79_113796 [Streptomyces cavourensis]